MFGIFNLLFLIFIIVIECPFYIKCNFIDNKTNINFINVVSGFSGEAFSCHVHVFPVLNTLKNPTPQRINILFKKSIILDISCYLIIGINGYLTLPINTPDLIIERKKNF